MRLPRLALCSFSYGAANGIARMDALLASGLAELGFPVERYVVDAGLTGEGHVQDGVSFLSVERAADALAEAFAHADAVQFNGGFDPCFFFAAARARVPVVLEVMHNNEPGGMHGETDAVVCVSERVRAAQLRGDCLVIPNGIDCERFGFKPGMRGEAPVLLQVVNAAKGIQFSLDELLPDLLDGRSDISVLLAGGRRFASHPGIRNHGVVPDLAPLYHQADLNMLACDNDAFGLTLAEGMACGCLPLASPEGGAKEFIEHGVNGWLVHGSRQAWLDSLHAAMDLLGSSAHSAMQHRARECIERRYSARSCMLRYADLYRSLWDRSPARRDRFAAANWAPLMQAALLRGHSIPRAAACLERFVQAGEPLEPAMLAHPGASGVLAICVRLGGLLLDDHKHMIRAFCALLRVSRITSEELSALERKARA